MSALLSPEIALPTFPGAPLCPTCGLEHLPGAPHDPRSAAWGNAFRRDHGRLPSWDDALAHCDADVRARWVRLLLAFGIDPGTPGGAA